MHEVGHNFYYSHMDDNERSSWDSLFNSLKSYQMPSDYAETAPNELWAEVYTMYYQPHRGREFLDPKITDWIDKHEGIHDLMEKKPSG